ncbi:MAG: hypothetical protein AAB855_03330 [Patescibacteria group bacterium]
MSNNGQPNFTENELRKSYWFVTHAARARQWALRAGIGVVVLIVLSFFIPFFGYLYYAVVRSERIIQPLRASASFVYPAIVLEDPVIRTTGFIDRGVGRYDVYAILENRHGAWRADANVIFTIGGADLPPVRTTLFPGDRRTVLSFGVSSGSSPSVSARFAEIDWTRLTNDEQDDITARRQVRITDVQLSGGRTAEGLVIPGTRAQFTLTNTSVYHLYDFRVLVLFKHAGTPVAAALVPVFSLERNKPARLEARWDYSFASTDSEIVLDIDVLNPRHVRPAL